MLKVCFPSGHACSSWPASPGWRWEKCCGSDLHSSRCCTHCPPQYLPGISPEPVSSTAPGSKAWRLAVTGLWFLVQCSSKREEGQVANTPQCKWWAWAWLASQPCWPSPGNPQTPAPPLWPPLGLLLHGWAGLAATKEGGWLWPWTLRLLQLVVKPQFPCELSHMRQGWRGSWGQSAPCPPPATPVFGRNRVEWGPGGPCEPERSVWKRVESSSSLLGSPRSAQQLQT